MKLVYLQHSRDQTPDFAAPAIEVESDSDALIARLRGGPGEVGCVVIASSRPDRGGLVDRIRSADPGVHLLLEGGSVSLSLGDLVAALAEPERDATRARHGETETAGMAAGAEEERLASMAALTAGIAHDVSTPMTAILGYAELIARSTSDEKNRKRAITIVEQVSRVRDLIQTLMQVAHGAGGPHVPVDLSGVIDRALASMADGFDAAGVAVDYDAGPVPPVAGDAGRLQRTFENLFQNSIDALDGGGTLAVTLRERAPSTVEVVVSDSGHGVSADIRKRIFEPYFSTRAGSKGLGLLVARTIAHQHGGEIRLCEENGKGASFEVLLPAAPSFVSD